MFRRALIAIAVAGLLLGFVAWTLDRREIANWCWAAGTIPVIVGLLVSMIHDFLAGRLGVDAVAFVSMSGALALAAQAAKAPFVRMADRYALLLLLATLLTAGGAWLFSEDPILRWRCWSPPRLVR